jgi:sporulation integral membrane protein YlbJ
LYKILIFLLVIVPFSYLVKKYLLSRDSSRAFTYILAFIGLALTVSMVFFPEDAFEAAVKGLDIWWNIVFPALLPFFVGSEILMGLGVVHFMGVLLEPLMRPVFRVPGVGSFVMAMGLASGFPIGSILTTRLRKEKLVSRVEGERLMSFTNTADPLFMFGAVAVGMFGLPEVGATIAAAHYLSSLSLGVLMRFYGRDVRTGRESGTGGNILGRALQALVQAREKDKRPLGQLMGDAIRNSVNTLLLIGGFIILFSVIIRIFSVLGIVAAFSAFLNIFLVPLGIHSGLSPAIISGFFEVTLGCQLAGSAPDTIPLYQKIMIAGSVIAWSGLSVHAQVASFISETDMRITPFVFARAIHALLAGVYTYLLIGPFSFAVQRLAVPVFLYTTPRAGDPGFWWQRTAFAAQRVFLVLLLLTFVSLLVSAAGRARDACRRRPL